MSVSNTLFIPIREDNTLDVLRCIVEDLNKWQRKQLDIARGETNRTPFVLNKDNMWTNGVKISSYDFNSFDITFGVGEYRRIFVATSCHSDYSDAYDGRKLILSVNCWGKHKEIMNAIKESLLSSGDVYHRENDGEFIKINQYI